MGVRLVVAALSALLFVTLLDSCWQRYATSRNSHSYFLAMPVPSAPVAPPRAPSPVATVAGGDGSMVIERLFRQPVKGPPLKDRSENELLKAGEAEVIAAASTFGNKERAFAYEWLAKVTKTEDPSARLEIMDSCLLDYYETQGDCQRLENALRKFRILLAPETGVVKQAKDRVREVANRFGPDELAFADKWLKKVDEAKDSDEGVIMDECIMTAKMGGDQSLDCFELEESLRNYRTAISVWQDEEKWSPDYA